MLLLVDWLRDFVEIDATPAKVADALTLATAEVEGVHQVEYPDPVHDGTRSHFAIEIDNKSLTHRPDLWGHLGLARELSTIYRKPLNDPFTPNWADAIVKRNTPSGEQPIRIEVAPDCACLGFVGIAVDGVSAKPSPPKIQQRLIALGFKPINLLVDIGNYVMLELGIPLHIYDRERITGGVLRVAKLESAAPFEALDGKSSQLLPGDTVISDQDGPVVLAGIIGGQRSAVSNTTSSIFIECANWRAKDVRLVSTRLGVRTDSSARYEKSLDSTLLERSALRALELVLENCPGATVVGSIQKVAIQSRDTPLIIKTSADYISGTLGKNVAESEVIAILEHLGFELKSSGNELEVKVPSYRATKDISSAIDLVEEIGRVTGYGSITSTAPAAIVAPCGLSKARRLFRQTQDFFVLHAHANEIMTYPMVGEQLLSDSGFGDLDRKLTLENPCSPEASIMRGSIIPTTLASVAQNQKHSQAFRTFEIGRAYLPDAKDFRVESTHLAYVDFNRRSATFVQVIEQIEGYFDFIGVGGKIEFLEAKSGQTGLVAANWSGFHPAQHLHVMLNSAVIAEIFSVNPALLKNFKIRGNLCLALVDLSVLEAYAGTRAVRYAPISQHPKSSVDCTVVAKPRITVQQIITAITSAEIPALDSVRLVSTFEMPAGERAVTIRATFADATRTLSGAEIKAAESGVVAALAAAGFGLKGV